MKERKSYIGKLNGISGVWCDQKPEGLEIEKEITFYSPDEGKVFTKDGEIFTSVVIKDGVKIEDYVEINEPKQEEPVIEEPVEESEE